MEALLEQQTETRTIKISIDEQTFRKLKKLEEHDRCFIDRSYTIRALITKEFQNKFKNNSR